MPDLFRTVARVSEDGSYVITGAPTAAERLERRRERANNIRRLMDAGVSSAVIAQDMGISRARVYQLLAYADLADRLESAIVAEAEPQEPVTDGRPAWSRPDAETLALCREIRAEMRAEIERRGLTQKGNPQ